MADINWNICCLCQVDTHEAIQTISKESCKSIANNLQKFHDIHALPLKIDILSLDEGPGIETTLTNHNAKSHKSCRLKIATTKLNRALKRHSKENQDDMCVQSKRMKRTDIVTNKAQCFFCNEEAALEDLREASTFQVDLNIRRAAYELNDLKLISKLNAYTGDLIAREAKYHIKCLTALYNRVRSKRDNPNVEEKTEIKYGIAFDDLTSYIDEARLEDEVPVFKLAELASLYSEQLQQLGVPDNCHSTRLKNRLLNHYPDMKAYSKGRDVLLSFDADIGDILKNAQDYTYEDDAMIIAKAARLIRREIFSKSVTFSGSFEPDCQDNASSKARSLIHSLIQMILEGPNISNHSSSRNQAVTSVCQLIQFNTNKKNDHLLFITTETMRRLFLFISD